jgi:hypothetical protein
MLHFKSFPKCTTGTIESNSDAHGSFLQCLNCGFQRDTADDVSERAIKSMLKQWQKELQAQENAPSEAIA